MRNWKDLKAFAEAEGFYVTSTIGGNHNVGSKHALGLAIDVRTHGQSNEQIERFIRKARAIGIIVRDEREKPEHQKVWSGAHLHLEIGAQTLETLREFQRANNLTVDGIAGKLTLAALDSPFRIIL